MKSFEPIDEKLIKSFVKGDQAAFEKVYEIYQKYVYRLAYQFFNNEELAKDAVQETFLKAFRSRKQLKTSKAIVTWLNRICYSCCLDIYRKSKVDSIGYYEDSASERIEFLKSKKDIDLTKQLYQQDAKNAIIDILEELRPEYKTIAYLRFFEELKHKEIAEITGMDVKSIGTYIQRVKAIIIKKLNERGFSKSSCLSVITIPFLIEFYEEFTKTIPSLPAHEDTIIRQNLKEECKNKKPGFKNSYLLIAFTALLSGGVLVYKNTNIINEIFPIHKVAIINVEYNRELTNQSLKINVVTSNENYDQILINHEIASEVKSNGEHLIELMKNGEVVDSRIIKITNIDKEIPEVTSEVYDGDKVLLTINDKDSGIDYTKIKLLENGEESKRIDVNEKNATILIKRDVSIDNVLKIPDLAGNVLNVHISFY